MVCSLNGEQLVYSMQNPTLDGRTELILTPRELLERLSKLVTPPQVHKHRYCGVLAPNARLRRAVIESAGSSGATLKILKEARREMGLEDTPGPDFGEPTEPPAILPARSPPQEELDFTRAVPADLWFEVDQTADQPGDSWE